MIGHLWAEGDAPWEYIKLVLERDVYHCTPSALRKENLVDVFTDLKCLSAEAQVQKMKEGRS